MRRELEPPTFNGRLVFLNTTTLQLSQYNGRFIEVNDEILTIPDLTIGTSWQLRTTDSLIGANGFPTGSGMAASTLYYIYLGGPQITGHIIIPGVLRASLTAPSTLYHGGRYLGTGDGYASNWRFVGYARTNASTQFVAPSDTQAFVMNYYNRRSIRLFTCPGYVNDNLNTLYTLNNSSWASINGGTGSKLEFISNGEDIVTYRAFGTCSRTSGVATDMRIGVGEDSTTSPIVSATIATPTLSDRKSMACGNAYQPAEGYRFLELLNVTPTTHNQEFVADVPRNGAAADPKNTCLTAVVMG